MINGRRAAIDVSKCQSCPACDQSQCPAAENCPARAIAWDDLLFITTDCVGCGKCLKFCKCNAIVIV